MALRETITKLTTVLPQLAGDLLNIDLELVKADFARLAGLKTAAEIYVVAARICDDKTLIHPEWGLLAGRVATHGLAASITTSFSEGVRQNPRIYAEDYRRFVAENAEELEKMLCPERNMNFDRLGINTLSHSYLLRADQNGETVYLEEPQFMYLRVACFLWYPNLAKIRETYDSLSKGEYSHASPTMYNAGTRRPQLASCFLMSIDDSLEGLTKSWRDCAIISKNTGGLGCDYSGIRHSSVGYFGESKGIVNWLRIKQEILRSVDQGGRRKGSGAMYIPPWHIDVEAFLELRKNTGPEEMRARDLFQALWVSDLFMERVLADEKWSLFCPNRASGLTDLWGAPFKALYERYEAENRYTKQIRARDLWQKIVFAQKETGMPFMLYKDACNRKSNQQNLGTIRCSNLCVEILEYTSSGTKPSAAGPKATLSGPSPKESAAGSMGEIASCNLGSVVLPKCVVGAPARFDFKILSRLTRALVDNLNQTIDRNYYPKGIPEIPYANFKNRPIGIGVQGLADTFALLDLCWESPEARRLNREIFEGMYYAATERSVELAERDGAYESFAGSPASKGLFQFDLWRLERSARGVKEPAPLAEAGFRHSAETWDALRSRMVAHGLRNSLLIALMPTASTAQILRNNESFEPYTQNIYLRTVLSGTFKLIVRPMVADLERIGLWTTNVVQQIVRDSGSLANVRHEEPCSAEDAARLEYLKRKYKTAYEISQKTLLQMALDRGEFVDQSQSFNAHFPPDTNFQQITSFHFYGWQNGAKTGMYYLKQPALTNPMNFALSSLVIGQPARKRKKAYQCDEDVCVACNV